MTNYFATASDRFKKKHLSLSFFVNRFLDQGLPPLEHSTHRKLSYGHVSNKINTASAHEAYWKISFDNFRLFLTQLIRVFSLAGDNDNGVVLVSLYIQNYVNALRSTKSFSLIPSLRPLFHPMISLFIAWVFHSWDKLPMLLLSYYSMVRQSSFSIVKIPLTSSIGNVCSTLLFLNNLVSVRISPRISQGMTNIEHADIVACRLPQCGRCLQ